MNKARTSERWTRLSALVLSVLFYVALVCAIGFLTDRLLNQDPAAVSVSAVNLSFAQMELVAAEETSLPPEPEPPPPEEVDVVLEEIIKKPEPEPEPEPVIAEAQVTQEAAAPEPEVNSTNLQDWVFEQIEKEKYYPASARRAGFEGTFELLVTVDAAGTITSAEVVSGKGHSVLKSALEKIVGKLIGRNFGWPLGDVYKIPVEFGFDLE